MSGLRTGFTIGPGIDVEDGTRWAADRGFDHVELLFDGPFARERLERRDDLAAYFEGASVDLVVHLPFALDIGSPFTPVREGAIAELVAGLDLARELGAEKAVFHSSSNAWDLGWSDDELRGFVRDSTREVSEAARERGIEPCAENVIDGPYDVTGFSALLEATDVSMTFDAGHARLAGFDAEASAAFLETHRERVSHVHLSDNRGGGDEHLPVGMGTIDFSVVLAPLLESGWEGSMTHEVGTTDLSYVEGSQRALEALL